MKEQKNNLNQPQPFQPQQPQRPPSVGWRVFGWLVFIGIIISTFGFIIIYSGIYNVAASKGHSLLVEWIFSTVSDNSVQYHSSSIKAPTLTHDMAVIGAEYYGKMCVGCHGGPGRKKSGVGQGLYPPPPDLVGSAKEMKPSEIFWVIKNGIVDTGMPSFGVTNDDEKIWDITTFVLDLPKLSPTQFEQMVSKKGFDSD
jgi:mono/diheme cytochrome c family protein